MLDALRTLSERGKMEEKRDYLPYDLFVDLVIMNESVSCGDGISTT